MNQACFSCTQFMKCPSEVRIAYVRRLIFAFARDEQAECKDYEEKRFRGLEGVRP